MDRCWGIHVYADLAENKMSVDAGPRMAGSAVTTATFKGKGGHGSRPDMARNPVFAAAAFLNNLSMVFGQKITAGQTVTLGITMVHAGEASNVIADTAELSGSFRFFDGEEGKKSVRLFRKTAEETAAIFGCTVEFGPRTTPEAVGFPVINDAAAAALAQRVLPEVLPEGTIVSCEPWYASESFRKWLAKYPGVFAFLGIKNEEEGFGALHHNEKFDLNDKVLKTGALATVRYAAEWLIQE